MKYLEILVTFCTLFLKTQGTKHIPDYISRCKKSDPIIGDCIKNSIEQLKPRLMKGIPELNVVPLDPFLIKELIIFKGQNHNSVLGLKASLLDLEVTGVQSFKINSIKVNPELTTFHFEFTLSKMNIKGKFALSVGPISDNGRFLVDVVHPNIQGVLSTDLIDYNGHKQLNITELNIYIKMKDHNLEIEDNFKGLPVLKSLVDEVLLNNKNELFEVAIPYIEQKIVEILLHHASSIVNDLPFDKLFPE